VRERSFGHALPPHIAIVGKRDIGKMVLRLHAAIAFGFDRSEVPGATPK
jgi:hypothetical protein